MYRRSISAYNDARIEERLQKMKDDSNRQHQEYLAKMDAKMEADQKRAEARLAADRKEAEARQRATEERLAQERKESEKRLRTHTRWLVATFFTAFFAMIGVFVSLLISNGYLSF